MDIIKKFGDMVGERSIRDPEKARKLLLTGYRLQEKRLQLFPDRKLPASGQYVARVVMQNIIKALAKPDDTALVSIFVPGELLTAAGLTPYSVEAMSCFIAGTRCEQAFLAQTESEGFPETMCSYHRVFLGASMTGLVPKPKCTIYTNLAAMEHDDVSYLKQKYQIPGFYIDVPYEKNQDSISYVADQLRELKEIPGGCSGKKISEQSVQRAVANSNEAASYYSSQLALRKDHDPVTSLTNELYAIFMCHLLAGSEESLKYTKMLLEDVKKIYENSDHQGILKADGSAWNAYVVKVDDLDWYLVQCMQQKKLCIQKYEEYYALLFLGFAGFRFFTVWVECC